MSEIVERMKEKLAQLDQKDRAELAHFLLVSLDDGEDADAEEAWDAELARRWEEFQSGRSVGVPWEVAMAELRAKHGSPGPLEN